MKSIYSTFMACLFTMQLFANTINIADMGAKGDGKTDNTAIIQRAIEAGVNGTIIIPAGTFVTGPLFLTSNISIYLENGATLAGSTRLDTYRKVFAGNAKGQPPALIYGNNIENVTIYGQGTLDGQGGHPNFQLGDDSKTGAVRPILIYIENSRHISIRDIHIRNSAYWVQKYASCDGVVLRGLNVYSHCNFNNDGIDINGSKNVIISDCLIDSDDDALCFKSDHTLCENMVVSNCVVRSNCNAIKFGTGSASGFKNITVSNCVIHKASDEKRRHWKQAFPWMKITQDTTVIAGIALEVVDGGVMDQVIVSNITMQDVQTPVFIRLGDRSRKVTQAVSVLKNVSIHDVIATSESALTSAVTGIPGSYIENVSISNVQINAPGGIDKAEEVTAVPENIAAYPENRMFGNILPAAAFYVRHVKNIMFDNIRVHTRQPDSRPAFRLEDVSGAEFSRCRLNGQVITAP
ncbi:polygalacturonase [Chitinophaga polysaccharea]|uniref:Polygalacturonase n=1 Tax=Chitinophaga polysaccharea TaxID=1293035 RepID=A0A561P3X4_9BACT|nr:glycosyl hydrolase family 28 protein [Chitinophaga polysaccharea]TWF32821.1 polygalacturonase [Chitinophaga polysaccharea]